MSRKLEDSAGPKSQNGKMNFNRDIMKYTNIEIQNSILSLNFTDVLRAENLCVCCGPALESRTELIYTTD